MILDLVTVGPLQENCYIIICPQTREAAVIDPGDEPARIMAVVSFYQAKVKLILATHGHFDHVLGVAGVKERTGASFLIPPGDKELIEEAHEQAALFGIIATPVPSPDGFIDEGQTIDVGTLRFQVLSTPGHTPGGVSLYTEGLVLSEVEGHVFSGDCLFAGSIGRTDFPNASYETLMESLHTKLLTLPDETIVHPGHGPQTTIGHEKRTNPFLVGLRL